MLHITGVPTYAGALYPGTDTTPAALRNSGLQLAFEQAGVSVTDAGDIALPDNLPRHNTAPVRNWPGPRLVWESITAQGESWFAPDKFNLLLGGDCSIIVGTTDYLAKLYGDKLYLIVIDAHVDVVKPDPEVCVGAAAMGLWFLTNENLLWTKPATISSEQITVVGCQQVLSEVYGIHTIALETLRESKLQSIAAVLAAIPDDAKLLVHFDVDAINQQEMPAAYAPSETGLTIVECKELLTRLVTDPRTIAMEVTEFSAQRDTDGSNAVSLIRLLSESISLGLKARPAKKVVRSMS